MADTGMAQKHGHVKISRKAYAADPFWNEERVFSRWEAWEDLIQLASWKARRQVVKSQVVELGRGDLLASERFLSERWSWSRGKVRRFLDLLLEMKRITDRETDRETDHLGRIVTLCNYDRYQGSVPRHGPPIEPQADHRRTTGGPPADQREVSKAVSSNGPSSTAREPKTGADRLRQHLGEHRAAIDVLAASADHSPTLAASIMGLYGPDGTQDQLWTGIPPSDQPKLLAKTMNWYAAEGEKYNNRLFRSFLQRAIHEHKNATDSGKGDGEAGGEASEYGHLA